MKNLPMTRRILNLLLAVLFLLLPCLAFAEEPKPTTADPAYDAMELKAGEIIVKFKEGIPKASVQSLLLAGELEVLDEMDQLGIMLLSVPEGQELEKIEELKRDPLVEYAEPNHAVRIADTIAIKAYDSPLVTAVIPNDPILTWQWNLPNIGAFAAWDITTGSDKVAIAFIDSGVYFDHPELKDKIWTNPIEKIGDANGDGFPGIQGVDDDGDGLIDEDSAGRQPGDADYANDLRDDDDENGYIDDIRGWDFVDEDGYPQDDCGRGTSMASIAAAETDNGILIAGVSWGAEIMPVKAFKLAEDGKCTSSEWATVHGIVYAADNGAKIINLSWSLRSNITPELWKWQDAVDYAHAKGALIVAGSGDPNPYDPTPLPPDACQYPAALEHVVSVAATGYDDEHPDFSTYNDMVDVAAPGVGIPGVWGKWYGYWSNTGVAAAHVSGLAALIWSVNPYLTNDQVEEIIKSTAVDLGEPGRDDYFGHGRIDASAAVRATPHYLEVDDDPLYFLVCDDGNPPSRKITNPNTNSSTWSAAAMDDWLSISRPEGHTPSSATVSVDRGILPDYDFYTGTIIATSTMTSCENCLRTLTVTAEYTQCWRSYLPLLFKKP
jgi:subtilisin family serine protease